MVGLVGRRVAVQRLAGRDAVDGGGDGGDLVEEPFVGAERRVFDGPGGVDDDQVGDPAVGLAAQHPAHALDHLAAAAAGGEDDGEVGGGDVDAFVEDLRRGDGPQLPAGEAGQDGATLGGIELGVDGGGRAGLGGAGGRRRARRRRCSG